MSDLFPDAPRRPKRVLMKVTDASECGMIDEMHMVYLECPRCEHTEGWIAVYTKSEALSQPCPKCNRGEYEKIQTSGLI